MHWVECFPATAAAAAAAVEHSHILKMVPFYFIGLKKMISFSFHGPAFVLVLNMSFAMLHFFDSFHFSVLKGVIYEYYHVIVLSEEWEPIFLPVVFP